jgi:hypothetical protein
MKKRAKKKRKGDWIKVVFAADCDDPWDTDGECLVCPNCQIEYAECPCPGPHQDEEFEYQERRGVLYARRIRKAE